jgi:carbohydrate diacid regulator
MKTIEETIAEISNIIEKNIVVVSDQDIISYPKNQKFDLIFSDIKDNRGRNYKGYNIYNLETDSSSETFLCIASESFTWDNDIKLASLLIQNYYQNINSLEGTIKRLLDGSYSQGDLSILNKNYSCLLGCSVIMIDHINDNNDEILEITKNSLDCQALIIYNGSIIVLSNQQDLEEGCLNLFDNILTEVYTEVLISIGGIISNVEDLNHIYRDCLRAMDFKRIFKLNNRVLNYEKMHGYRVISNLDKSVREYIETKVFNQKFKEMLSPELEHTIEELFKNNLNLTDTSNKLYIHRNTLLYRIDKINKTTGLDLKKFEDSWLFKLAWLIKKYENNK